MMQLNIRFEGAAKMGEDVHESLSGVPVKIFLMLK